jgi:GAF domain-containing protein
VELTPEQHDPTTHEAFTNLAQVVYSSDSFEETFAAICAAAPKVVAGCDHASLMVRRGDHFETIAWSDDIARTIDEAERRLGVGPCLDAIASEAAQVDADLATNPTWPPLAAWVLENTPVRGVAGFRLLADGRKVGALNFFSDTPGALSGRAADQAAVFTAFAAVVLLAMYERDEARNLRLALNSNREIGKAVGLLMALHKVDDDAALELLRKTSQDLNITHADVAREVVDYHRGRGEARAT